MSTGTNVSITRKRGRDEVDARECDARSFTIKPDASDPFGAPRTFTPVCLLSRAQLPLAYLDTAAGGSRLFAAHVTVLEGAHGHGDDGTVLLATEAKEDRLYAVERVKRRVYALCRLGEWVKEADVVARSRLVLREDSHTKRRALQQPVEKGQPWWMRAAVEMSDSLQKGSEIRPKIDMEVKRAENSNAAAKLCEEQPLPLHTQGPTAEDNDTIDPVQTTTDIMQELSKHYLEALYLSRTSLAYFTKGPLSRVRAAFAAMPDPAATSELVGFLRNCILSSTTMDKKFKDGIPSTVKENATDALASPQQLKKTKRKRKWKSKRDKHGFFTDEKDVVERWWLEHDDISAGSSSAGTVDEALRRRMPKLRSRETFMQLILILETLALEASLPALGEQSLDSQTPIAESQAVETQQEETQAVGGEKKQKPKKKQDLPSLLETLLDKLCIWHSLESHSPAKKSVADDDTEEVSDALKSFCFEVVVPFYASRISQHAAIVNKKLGGPSAPTPTKRKIAAARKPGQPAIRQVPEKKPRKPLARVGTDTLSRHAKAVPSLTRSASDADALTAYIKRETSEVPMDSIPATSQRRKPRQSLMHTLDSSRRQVDLNAMSQANDAKMQKKAEMQEKMQSAINMLRKPNRTAALAEIREQTDESFAKATAAGRGRSNHGVPKSKVAPPPQTTATPSHRRTVKATPYKRIADLPPPEGGASSGTTYVPSSSARLVQARDIAPSSSLAIPQTGHRQRQAAPSGGVEETPSRGFAKFMPLGLAREPGTLDSPTASRKVQVTPSKPVRSLSLGVIATPAASALVAASPNVQRRDAGLEMETEIAPSKSVYDSLGWDEDEYEELP